MAVSGFTCRIADGAIMSMHGMGTEVRSSGDDDQAHRIKKIEDSPECAKERKTKKTKGEKTKRKKTKGEKRNSKGKEEAGNISHPLAATLENRFNSPSSSGSENNDETAKCPVKHQAQDSTTITAPVDTVDAAASNRHCPNCAEAKAEVKELLEFCQTAFVIHINTLENFGNGLDAVIARLMAPSADSGQ